MPPELQPWIAAHWHFRVGPGAGEIEHTIPLTGGVLVYGTLDLPPFGSPDNPVHHHVAPRYIEESGHEIGVPNIVTSVLASYRGYDTMGETTVIFTAVVGVLLLLATGPQPRYVAWLNREEDDEVLDGAAGGEDVDG